MERWINLLGYQITWFITVTGANHGRIWPACLSSTVLCLGHLGRSSWRELDVRLLGYSLMLGTFLDGFLASTGMLRYSPPTPAVPVAGVPLWILALWVAFSTTLTRSLGWLRGRTGLTAVFGAAGGPLAYWAAARGWDVIAFPDPAWRGLLVLSIGWAIALVLLVRAATLPTRAQRTQSANRHEPHFP
jgi:hypothetical protein